MVKEEQIQAECLSIQTDSIVTRFKCSPITVLSMKMMRKWTAWTEVISFQEQIKCILNEAMDLARLDEPIYRYLVSYRYQVGSFLLWNHSISLEELTLPALWAVLSTHVDPEQTNQSMSRWLNGQSHYTTPDKLPFRLHWPQKKREDKTWYRKWCWTHTRKLFSVAVFWGHTRACVEWMSIEESPLCWSWVVVFLFLLGASLRLGFGGG